MRQLPIGIFDSGVGGLTVVKQIINTLPNEDIIYLGDTARVPYGTRSKEVITKFARELTKYLLKANVKFLVVACNTITSTCFDQILKFSKIPVLGVIDPAVEEALKWSKTKIIGVIGTPATINTGIYEKKIKKLSARSKIINMACPLFVPLAEEGLIDHKATYLIGKDYLSKFKKSGIDTMILGCTHYPILKNVIQDILGKNFKLIDSSKPTANALKLELTKRNLLNSKTRGSYKFLVTDLSSKTVKIASTLFSGKLPGKIIKVKL